MSAAISNATLEVGAADSDWGAVWALDSEDTGWIIGTAVGELGQASSF